MRELRHAVRGLVQSPGFSLMAVLILGMGIGAATAVFSLVDAVLLHPLPVRNQDRLVVLWGEMPARNQFLIEVSALDWENWRRGSRSFEDLAVYTASDEDVAYTGGDEPLPVRGRSVSGNYFRLLGAEAAHGRTFRGAEGTATGSDVVILSHGFWQRHLGSDPAAVGGTILLDGQSRTVIGVMGPSFHLPADVDLWTPLGAWAFTPEVRTLRIFKAVGRLKPGVTLEAARQDMAALSRQLARESPKTYEGHAAVLTPLAHEVAGDTRPALLLLLAAVALLLLIACANVAGLLLARAAARQREIAVRAALGAGRLRLARQLLAESLVLAGAAALLGLLLAADGLPLLAALGPADMPRLDGATLDVRALLLASLASLATLLLFGLLPALQAADSRLGTAALKEGGRSSTGLAGTRLRELLVAGEVALALMLLVGAGLVLRSFLNLERIDLGFDPQNVLTQRLTLFGNEYSETRQQAAFFREVLDRVETLPGVESASMVLLRPLSGPIGWDYNFNVFGQSADDQRTNPASNHERVSPGYFQTLRIPLLEGRDFTWSDGPDAPLVAIVNEWTAKRFWPGESALGKRLRWGRGDPARPWMTVVGVVGDARYREIEAVRPDIYVPFLQDPHWAMDLVVRTRTAPLSVAPAVADAVRKVHHDQPVARVTTLEEAIAGSVARPRLRTWILGLFAGLALLLAAVGLYGVIAYSVAQRHHEIGIRLALGARRGAVLLLVLGQGLRLALAGLALGLTFSLAVGATGWFSGLLYGVKPTDLTTFALVPLLLLAVALAASLLPALQALEIDPLKALRPE